MKKNQRDQFFDQLKEFAEKHGFAIRVAQTTPARERFSIQLWREDFKILGANPFDAVAFRFGIYENEDSAKAVPLTYLDNLVSDLESFVLKTPGARFSEKM